MDITEVKVFPIQEEKLKAFVSIVFDQCFMVNDIKIIQGRDGLFISMPSRKKKNGEFKDVAHPLNNETRRMIEDKVLGEYERVLAERGERPGPIAPRADADRADRTERGDRSERVERSERGEYSRELPMAAAGSQEAPAAPEKTLEEVEEMHLRDSFWNMT